ncbi:MAG: hypothetical protein IT353_07950 [Gemmatimonadaceae bacterium]|nr:hypothetical protein [Gemmatimonadaceae bacterium]
MPLRQSQDQSAQKQAQQAIQDAQRSAQDAARAASEDARQTLRDAQNDAKNDARDNQEGAPGPAQPPGREGTIVIPTDAGENIEINVNQKGINICQEGNCTTIPIQDVVPRGAVLMSFAVFGSLAFMVVGFPIARAFARWLDRRSLVSASNSQLDAALQARLEAMERNIDTVAIEVERVSEGQRFTNRLLEQRPAEHAQRTDR